MVDRTTPADLPELTAEEAEAEIERLEHTERWRYMVSQEGDLVVSRVMPADWEAQQYDVNQPLPGVDEDEDGS